MIDEQKFWSHVHKTDSCWLWTGVIDKKSRYGRFYTQRKKQQEMAHRFSYELVKGPIPTGMMACHRCDVRTCVNPDHLFLGTHYDNMADMVNKGRQDRGKNPKKRKFGERNGRAKLTIEQVEEIKRRYAVGDVSQTSLAKEYGIKQPQIWRIVRCLQWNVSPKEMVKKPKPKRGKTVTPLAERFWSKVQKGEGCWRWLGFSDKRGRSSFSIPRQGGGRYTSRTTSRVAYELANDCQLPDDIVVAHSCDNPNCVNPAHLRACSQLENIRECHEKERDRWSRARK